MKRLFALMILLSIAFAAPTAVDIADITVKMNEITPFDATGSTGDLVQYTWIWDDGDSDVSNYWNERITMIPPSTSAVDLHIGCSGDMFITNNPNNYEAFSMGPVFDTIGSAVTAGQPNTIKPAIVSDKRWLMAGVDGIQSKVFSFKCDDVGHNVDMDWVPSKGNEITALGYLPPSGMCVGGECIAGGQMIAGVKDSISLPGVDQYFLFYNAIKSKPPDFEKTTPQGTEVMSLPPTVKITSIETYRDIFSGAWIALIGGGSPPRIACHDNSWALADYNEFSVPGYLVTDNGEVTAMYTGIAGSAIIPMNPPGEFIVASAKLDGVWIAKLHRASFKSNAPNCADIAGSFVEYPALPLSKVHDIEVNSGDGSLWIAGETPAGEARVFYSLSRNPATAVWMDAGELRDDSGSVPNVAESVMYNYVDGLMYASTGSAEAQVFRGSLSPLASHAWVEPGTYDGVLTATESDGSFDTDDFEVTVAGRLAQVGIVVKPGAIVKFTGAYSTINDGSITNYDWDFDDGDTATGEEAEHKFINKGKYLVKLTLTGDKGDKASSYFLVLVGTPPVAKMSVNPSPSEVGDTVTFDATQSFDTDGIIESYEWDFPNAQACMIAANPIGIFVDAKDGTPLKPGYPVEKVACDVPEDSKACYKFQEPCDYDVMLDIIDDDGLTDELGYYHHVDESTAAEKVWDLDITGPAEYSTRVGEITKIPITVGNVGYIESAPFEVCRTDIVDGPCAPIAGSIEGGEITIVELPSFVAACGEDEASCEIDISLSVTPKPEGFVFTTVGALPFETAAEGKSLAANSHTLTLVVATARDIDTDVLTPEFPLEALLLVVLLIPLIAFRRLKN